VASAFSLMAKHSTEPTALAAGLWMPPIEGPEASALSLPTFLFVPYHLAWQKRMFFS
jgi:hypothetical protein